MSTTHGGLHPWPRLTVISSEGHTLTKDQTVQDKEKGLLELVARMTGEDSAECSAECAAILDAMESIIDDADRENQPIVPVGSGMLALMVAFAGLGYAWTFHRGEFPTLFPETKPASPALLLPSDN